MEIRVYRDLSAYTASKPLYCTKVSCPDAFSFQSCLDVFRSIYGSEVIIVFICV